MWEKAIKTGQFSNLWAASRNNQTNQHLLYNKKDNLTHVPQRPFLHSLATHFLQANYDIRTIQELLGHSDVGTTMIYTHTIKSRTLKEAKSPLDF